MESYRLYRKKTGCCPTPLMHSHYKLKPDAAHAVITARSSASDAKKTGMVILVGNAARFTTSTDTIDSITNGRKNIFTPDIATTIKASGVIIQP